MNWFYRVLLLIAFVVLPTAPRVFAQEAVEIRGDQDSPESSPSSQTVTKPEPPAESDTETSEQKPKKKPKGVATSVQEMNPDEFKRAGLDKLSPAELQTLNEWLKGYRHQAEQHAAAQVTEQTKQQAKQEGRAEAKSEFNRSWMSADRVFSRVDGEFHGLRKYTRKAIIRLEDGTVWKQANESDNFDAKLTDHPPVMVTHSFAGYKMHVIGAGEFWVNPVRQH